MKEKKMNSEDVQGLLHMRRRAYSYRNRKGKGSYNRQEFKKEEKEQERLTENQ